MHAHALVDYSGVYERGSVPVSRTMLVGGDMQARVAKDGHRVLDVRAIVPDVTVNRAQATVRVMECTVNGHGGLGMSYLSDAKEICARFEPFRPGPVDLGFPATEIAFVVTAHHPGQVRVEGAEVTYVDGAVPGRQHVGAGFVLHLRPAKP
jgi:hypothetical protein